MYNVIIVEDELLVRLGLKNTIDWSKFDMRVAADFPDGQSAWEYILRNKPDIVITDIKMPVMDGITLIAKIRDIDKAVRIVILTCVEEFEYARKALAFGVSDYIPKLTMSAADIEKMLSKLKEELDSANRSCRDTEDGMAEDYIAKDQLLRGYLLYDLITDEQFASYHKKYRLRFEPKALVLCVMEISHSLDFQTSSSVKGGNMAAASIFNTLNELLRKYPAGEAFHDEGGRYLIVLNLNGGNSSLDEAGAICMEIEELLKIYFSVTVSFGISHVYDGLPALKKMYREAADALRLKFWMGPGIYTNESLKTPQDFSDKIKAIKNISEIKKLVGEQRYLTFCDKVDEFAKDPVSSEQTIEFFGQMYLWISCNLYSDFSDDVISIAVKAGNVTKTAETLDECVTEMRRFLGLLTVMAGRNLPYSKEVLEAIQYMRFHLTENITLSQVADAVNISAGYFSTLFKKETKTNFTEYLSRLRIEQAKKLLLGSRQKIFEVAETVGFSDNTYFCRVFHDFTGLSPSNFRKRAADIMQGDMYYE